MFNRENRNIQQRQKIKKWVEIISRAQEVIYVIY